MRWPCRAAAEEESRYSEWRQEGAEAEGSEALEALARELEALIDDAEKARAADPRFLQDLRDMIAAHVAEAEPREALIRDDFSDGDYTDDPSWDVVSGEFSVDDRLGLRTTIPLSGADTKTMRLSLDTILDAETIMETKDELLDKGGELLDKGRDTVDDLLSGEKTFGDLLGGDDDDEANQDTGPDGPEPAMIVLEADIPNAFALEVEMMSGRRAQGRAIRNRPLSGQRRGFRLSPLLHGGRRSRPADLPLQPARRGGDRRARR